MKETRLGDIVVLDNIHSVTSITKEDYMASQSMLYHKTVIGSAITITTLFLTLTKTDNIDIDKLKNIYARHEDIKDFQSLVNVIHWIRDQQDDEYNVYQDGDKYVITSMMSIDDYLTATINNYLKYSFNLNISIDSAYLDLDELYSYLSPRMNLDEVGASLVNYCKDTLAVNYKNIDFIQDFINTNQQPIEQDCVLYIIPRLHIYGLTHLNGFYLKRLQNYLKSLMQGSKVITVDHPEYQVLEDIYNNSKEFKRHSKILISYFTNTDNNIYSERKSLEVWKNIKNEFVIIK